MARIEVFRFRDIRKVQLLGLRSERLARMGELFNMVHKISYGGLRIGPKDCNAMNKKWREARWGCCARRRIAHVLL